MIYLSDVYMGMVVRKSYLGDNDKLVGMIKGISENSFKEVCLVVDWQDGVTSDIHPSRIEKVGNNE